MARRKKKSVLNAENQFVYPKITTLKLNGTSHPRINN
jgi:hypothetical protein